MRTELYISPSHERRMISRVYNALAQSNLNASNATLIAVSTDYSSLATQVLRHALSHDEEIADALGVDVPYPDQQWSDEYEANILHVLSSQPLKPHLILVEAGVIRGSNYRNLTNLIARFFPGNTVITTTLFENRGSAFKSDIVGEYYDDATQDLTFWWERPNKHWN